MEEGGGCEEGNDEGGEIDLRDKKREWKSVPVLWHAVPTLTGMPLSSRKRPELGLVEVKFQPWDHCDMLLSSMNFVGMLRMR